MFRSSDTDKKTLRRHDDFRDENDRKDEDYVEQDPDSHTEEEDTSDPPTDSESEGPEPDDARDIQVNAMDEDSEYRNVGGLECSRQSSGVRLYRLKTRMSADQVVDYGLPGGGDDDDADEEDAAWREDPLALEVYDNYLSEMKGSFGVVLSCELASSAKEFALTCRESSGGKFSSRLAVLRYLAEHGIDHCDADGTVDTQTEKQTDTDVKCTETWTAVFDLKQHDDVIACLRKIQKQKSREGAAIGSVLIAELPVYVLEEFLQPGEYKTERVRQGVDISRAGDAPFTEDLDAHKNDDTSKNEDGDGHYVDTCAADPFDLDIDDESKWRRPARFEASNSIPEGLWNRLYSFQREGVIFSVRKHGRVLIADEMGLGKTITALATAMYYRSEWPMLCIVPSSVRYNWKSEIERWLPPTNDSDSISINVIDNGRSDLKVDHPSDVTIITYDLVERFLPLLQRLNIGLVICDESHYLKNPRAKRTQLILPTLQNTQRVLLLSGTPALARPIDLFTQLSVLNKHSFPSMRRFGFRYCSPYRGWKNRWDFRGASYLIELNARMQKAGMIRRAKADVLGGLPAKKRTISFVRISDATLDGQIDKGSNDGDGDGAGAGDGASKGRGNEQKASSEGCTLNGQHGGKKSKIDKGKEAKSSKRRARQQKLSLTTAELSTIVKRVGTYDRSKIARCLESALNEEKSNTRSNSNKYTGNGRTSTSTSSISSRGLGGMMFNPKNRSMVMNMYRDSGVAKLSLVCSLARSLIRQRVKIIVFAHHQIVLDGLCVVVEEEIQRLNLSNKQQHSPSSTRNPRKDANAATRTSTDTTTETVGDYMNAKTNTKACANTTDIIPTATDTRLPYSYIRIDGKTTSKARSNHVRSFQQQPSCVAAVLSITAAGQGITLTAACTVVFAELYWNPGHLLQAEDRVHRLGQRDVTKVHYVLGKETIDDIMWPLVSKKLGVINASVSGVQNAELRAVVLGNKDVLPYLTGGGGKGIQASRDGCSKRDETSDQVDGDGDSDGDGNSTDGNNDDSEDDKDDSEYDDDARVDTRKVGDNANESSGNRGRDRKSEKGSAANKASACGGMSSIVSILGNPLPQKRKQEPVLSLIEKLRKSRQRLVHSDSDTD